MFLLVGRSAAGGEAVFFGTAGSDLRDLFDRAWKSLYFDLCKFRGMDVDATRVKRV